MIVAEVLERKGGVRLRVGFGEDGELLEPEPDGPALEPKSFVFARRTGDGRARVETGAAGAPRVAAAAGTALAGVYRIAARSGVDLGFSDDALAEAAAAARDPGTGDPRLVDLSGLDFVTIDYAESRDLDQALHIARTDGGYRVSYALADAAHFVGPASAMFELALARGASFYLPGLTAPMLPRELSEGITSLNEGAERRALVFRIEVDATDGDVRATEIVRARVRSRRKLTYDGVQAYIDDPGSSPLAGEPFCDTLDLLGEVGRLRIARADERDVVDYDRVAVRLGLDDPGDARLAMRAERRNDVQRWNEQISLLTNIEGARFLTAHVDPAVGVAGVFRVHPPPDPADLDRLAASIDDLVTALELDEAWRWRRAAGESLADYVERLPDEGEEARLAAALQRQAMLVNHPSSFAIEPGPHYGIGAAAYSRFSSPMREIVGIVTEHLAYHQLDATSVAASGITRELLERAVAAGNRSKRLQKRVTRRANKLAMDQLFEHELALDHGARPRRAATVLGVSDSKIYVQLDDPPIEIKLYVPDQNELLDCRFELVSRFELRSTEGRSIRVGDAIEVRVHSYAEGRERWILWFLDS